MRKIKSKGFDYFLTLEKIKEYRAKPIEKRLEWLYQGNLFRKGYSRRIINLHNKFRQGKI